MTCTLSCTMTQYQLSNIFHMQNSKGLRLCCSECRATSEVTELHHVPPRRHIAVPESAEACPASDSCCGNERHASNRSFPLLSNVP